MDHTQTIWIEKYRPQSIDDLCLPEECEENLDITLPESKIFLADLRMIRKLVDNPAGLQNMLFFSEEYGTGKTSTLKLIGKLVGARTKFINASLNADGNTIENEMMAFAGYNNMTKSKSPKLIILDEVDGAKVKAFQEPLKAAVEYIANTTRIGLSCNAIDNIIGAIKSRMVKVDFSHSNPKYIKEIKQKMLKRLISIAENEDVEYEEKFLKQLIDNNYPDFRNIIDTCQQIVSLCGKLVTTNVAVQSFSYETVCDALMKGDYLTARTEHLKMQMSPALFSVLLRYFEKLDINPLVKLNIIVAIGNASNFHNEAANKEVNIAYMFANICKITKDSK